ncbi:DoxX family membrane protein [Stappia sp. GBMRC 2046]|uniref:DoxX family membrane protein n=1 Tax=Stappia sediminis TaxID=2692190 RepID=A0A7X3S676_9HYPH|nr:DoxX family protein [Stappia sediminis]MXN63737.1 DoxX family membrane protein [Stappia sediminis]
MTDSQGLSGVGAMLLRVALGIMWIAHASLKFLVFGIAGFASWLESQGLPSIFAWPVPLMEIILGLAMVFGVYSRYAAILLIPILLTATTVHLGNGWVFSNEGGGWEYPVFLFVAMLAHILIGDGSHAIKPSRLPIDGEPAA